MMQSLQELCIAVLREDVSVKILHGLPLPVTEELAVCLSPSQLLELEEKLRSTGTSEAAIDECTTRAWRHQCERCRYTAQQKPWGSRRAIQHLPGKLSRDVWLQSYASKYLLQHFYTWKPHLPGTHARRFLFSARDMETIELFSPMSFDKFVEHTASVVKLVKYISVRSKALLGMGKHQAVIAALKTNLLAIKVDCLRYLENTETFLEFLKILKELTGQGCLRSVSLTSAILSHDSWFLLFFLASGLLLCQPCAQHFAAVMKCGSEVSVPVMKRGSEVSMPVTAPKTSSDSACMPVRKIQGGRLSSAFENFSDCGSRCAEEDEAVISADLRGFSHELYFCHGQGSDFFRSLERLGYIEVNKGSIPSEHTSTDVETDRKMVLPSTLSEQTDADVTDCVKMVEGLSDQLDADVTDCTVSLNAGIVHSMSTGEKQTCNGGKIEESDSDTSEPMDEVDLLDEALGVTAGRPPHTSSDWTWRTEGCAGDACGHQCPGVDAEGCRQHSQSAPGGEQEKACGSQALAACWLMTYVSRHHISHSHTQFGVEDVSLNSPCHRQSGSQPPATLVQALHTSLHSWLSLSSLHLNMCKCFYLCHDIHKLMEALVCKIGQGTLKSLWLVVRPDPVGEDTDWHCPAIEQFFWKTLRTLASSGHSHGGCQPMHLLRIDSTCEKMTFSDTSFSIPGEHRFRGLQQLRLCGGLSFAGPEVFSPLAQFICRDDALSELSLEQCRLDSVSCDLLLRALSAYERGSLHHLNLCGVLCELSDSHWQQVCRLLTHCPALGFLSLACCSVTGDTINSAEFVTAVRSHRNSRKLNLDLSGNLFGDSIWDFMIAAVGPESSLTGLCFLMTHSTSKAGITAVKRITQEWASHQPVLGSCRLSASGSRQADGELKSALQEICGEVDMLFDDMVPEYLAVM